MGDYRLLIGFVAGLIVGAITWRLAARRAMANLTRLGYHATVIFLAAAAERDRAADLHALARSERRQAEQDLRAAWDLGSHRFRVALAAGFQVQEGPPAGRQPAQEGREGA